MQRDPGTKSNKLSKGFKFRKRAGGLNRVKERYASAMNRVKDRFFPLGLKARSKLKTSPLKERYTSAMNRVKNRFFPLGLKARSKIKASPLKERYTSAMNRMKDRLFPLGLKVRSKIKTSPWKFKAAARRVKDGFSPWRFKARSAALRFRERFKQPVPIATSVLLKQNRVFLDKEGVTVDTIIKIFSQRSYGLVLFFFASLGCIPAPPVIASIIGLPLLFFSVQMVFSDSFWLPKKLKNYPLPQTVIRKGIDMMIRILEYVEKVAHPRWSFIVLSQKWLGILMACFSATIIVPLPLTNLLPALGIIFISLGWLEKDGVLGMIGMGIGLFGISLTGIIVLSLLFLVI